MLHLESQWYFSSSEGLRIERSGRYNHFQCFVSGVIPKERNLCIRLHTHAITRIVGGKIRVTLFIIKTFIYYKNKNNKNL